MSGRRSGAGVSVLAPAVLGDVVPDALLSQFLTQSFTSIYGASNAG